MYTHVTKDTHEQIVASTEKGVLLCHKNMCPHCKNMEKVLEKFKAKQADATLLSLNSDDEPEAMAALGAERVPTVMIIKGGKVVGSKTGLMNPRELAALYDQSK